MIFWPFPMLCKPEFVKRRLRELGRHLADLTLRVRQAVLEAIRSTMADLAGDTVDRLLVRHLARSDALIQHPQPLPQGEFDPWSDEHEYCEGLEAPDQMASAPEPDCEGAPAQPQGSSALTFGVAAASWWLRQQGSLLGACGIAVLATAAAALANVFERLPLVAATELWKLQSLLTACVGLLPRA